MTAMAERGKATQRRSRRSELAVIVGVMMLAVLVGCGPDAVVQAQTQCEARDGHTELLRLGPLYRCYEITVADDGWRMCSLSEPNLMVRTDEPDEPPGLPCANTKPRYPVDEAEMAAELLWPPSAVAPAGCEAAFDWYKNYFRSIAQAVLDGAVAHTSETADAANITAMYARFGHLFEQSSPRAEAVRDSCLEDLGIEATGATSLIYETEDEFNETYKTLVRECVALGVVDCGVLAPTAKKSCEGMSPEFVYLLDQETLDVFSLDGWPQSSRAIGCTLK